MNQEDFKKAMDIIGASHIHIAGDFVMEKHVGTEVANVEAGGIVNIANDVDDNAHLSTPQPATPPMPDRDEELFHYIHPSVDSKDEWRIHDEVKRLVRRNGIQEICQYLSEMKKEKKIMLPIAPSSAYTEMVRMGMPTSNGFNENTFRKYYTY